MIPVVLEKIEVLDRESIYRGIGLEWIIYTIVHLLEAVKKSVDSK